MSHLRIRVVYYYGTGDSLCLAWNKMTDGNYTFTRHGRGFELVGEGLSCEDADYVLVVNGGVEPDRSLFHKTIFCKMEPVFVDQRWEPATTWPLLSVFGDSSPNALEWHLNKTSEELLSEVCGLKIKGDVIGAVISGKQQSPGHVARVRFALFAQDFTPWEVYGNAGSNLLPWKVFLGSPTHKDEACVPYKYTFACENHTLHNYVTEKLVDCILAESLCFYDGAPNAASIINPDAFVKIDCRDHAGALETIKTAIANNEYEKRLPAIRAEKRRLLTSTTVLPRLWQLFFRSGLKHSE
jgi:hypothetical protein